MSVLAPPAPITAVHTLADWQALPEDDGLWRTECVAGCLVVAARPAKRHQRVAGRLFRALARTVPPWAEPLPEIDVVLAEYPLTVRSPDIAVIRAEASKHEPTRAADLLLAVEILSPGNASTDTVVKKREYAAAGIPEYWILDPEVPSLTIHQLDRSGRYQQTSRITGRATVPLLGATIPIDLAEITTI